MRAERNYGIDLLRIVAMIMIIMLHVLGRGGILESSMNHPFKHLVAWTLEIASYCAVNCYAMISGYVGFEKKFHISNIIRLWVEVVFYLISISIVSKLLFLGSVSLNEIISSFFPITQMKYWYFTAYFAVFFFMPFLNYLISTLYYRSATILIMCCIIIYSVLPIISGGSSLVGDIFVTAYGYSPLWIAILYLLGAYIKRSQKCSEKAQYKFLLVYALCVFITLCSKLIIEYIGSDHDKLYLFRNALISYTSPTILLAGVSLVLFFSKIKLKRALSRIIAFFTPEVFGVYIIHEHPIIQKFLAHRFVDYIRMNRIMFVFAVLGTVFSIWFTASMIDRLRLILFRALGINKLSNRIGEIVMDKGNKIIDAVNTHIS